MSTDILPIEPEQIRERKDPQPHVNLRYRVIEEQEIPGFFFCNQTGSVTFDGQTFGRFEEIDCWVRGCFTVRRSMELEQLLSMYVNGRWRDFKLDHRTACGWRNLGIEPLLEVDSLATGERHFFVYTYHSEGYWLWCHVTPTTDDIRGIHTMYQLNRLKFLLIAAALGAGYYLGVSALAVAALWKMWSL